MTNRNITFAGRLTSPLHTVGALMRDVFMTAKAPDFCCGIQLERRPAEEEMPTPGSCCGVRF